MGNKDPNIVLVEDNIAADSNPYSSAVRRDFVDNKVVVEDMVLLVVAFFSDNTWHNN
jgi:hypothetical protein